MLSDMYTYIKYQMEYENPYSEKIGVGAEAKSKHTED